MKKEKEIRDTVCCFLGIALLLCGFIGLHYDDWTLYVLVIPFGWGLVGILLDMAINRKGNRESAFNAMCGVLILLNIATIIKHRDTLFIIGRLLAAFGLVIFIIRGTKKCEESTIKRVKQDSEQENNL